MHDPGLKLALAPDGTVSLSRATPDAPLSRLAIYNAAGVAVSVTPLDLSKRVTVPKLAAGRYQVCVQSDATATYVAGSACEPWIVAGQGRGPRRHALGQALARAVACHVAERARPGRHARHAALDARLVPHLQGAPCERPPHARGDHAGELAAGAARPRRAPHGDRTRGHR